MYFGVTIVVGTVEDVVVLILFLVFVVCLSFGFGLRLLPPDFLVVASSFVDPNDCLPPLFWKTGESSDFEVEDDLVLVFVGRLLTDFDGVSKLSVILKEEFIKVRFWCLVGCRIIILVIFEMFFY